MIMQEWAREWGISLLALEDLKIRLGAGVNPAPHTGKSETAVQSRVRAEAPAAGYQLFRNNVGAAQDRNGRPVRYGLANDSAELNEHLKSSDLIGWRSLVITAAMVGMTVAQFVARECKKEGWKYCATQREKAQLKFINLVNTAGGNAAFVNREGTL